MRAPFLRGASSSGYVQTSAPGPAFFLLQVQRLFSQEVAARYIATADHILEGVHFLKPGGSPSPWRAWARWGTRNQRELVTLFLASLADTFALQQLTQHSGY